MQGPFKGTYKGNVFVVFTFFVFFGFSCPYGPISCVCVCWLARDVCDRIGLWSEAWAKRLIDWDEHLHRDRGFSISYCFIMIPIGYKPKEASLFRLGALLALGILF